MHGAPPEGQGHHVPRWVKVLLIIGLAVGLIVVGVRVFGNGEHGPSRHVASGREGSTTSGGHAAPQLEEAQVLPLVVGVPWS